MDALGASLLLAAILGGWTIIRRITGRHLQARYPVDVTVERLVQLPWTVALAGELPDPTALMSENDHLPDRDVYDWLLGQGGVEHGETSLRIVLTSRSERTVTISNLRVIVKRSPSVVGSCVRCPAGGGRGATVLLFNLDDEHLVARERHDDGFELRDSARPYFDSNFISLDEGEAHTIVVACTGAHYLYSWTLALDLVVGKHRTTMTLDDNGSPFRTNGGPSDSFLRLYHWAWYDGGGFKPVT